MKLFNAFKFKESHLMWTLYVVVGFLFVGNIAFAQESSLDQLTNPSQSQAATPAYAAGASACNIYEVVGRPGEQMSLRLWVKSVGFGGAADGALGLVCGGEVDSNGLFCEKTAECVPPLNEYEASIKDGRLPGGLAALSAGFLDAAIMDTPIPTDMALFMNDTFGDTMFGSPSYAQAPLSQPTPFFQNTTFALWKFARNVALSLAGVFLTFAALAIIFRQKISPQAVVTISAVLPYVPIAIIGIVLSYPIMAVAYNSIGRLMSVGVSVGNVVIDTLLKTTPNPDLGALTIYAIISAAISAIVASVFSIAAGAVISIPLIFVLITMIVTIVVAFFRYAYEYAKTIVSMVLLTIAFPFVSAIAILPTKQGVLVLFLKKILVNILILPVLTIFLMTALGFIITMGSNDLSAGSYFLFSPAGILSIIIKFMIGIGIAWQGFKTRKILEGALGASGSIMSAIEGAEDKKR